MTKHEFKSNKKYVKSATQLCNSPMFKTMLSVIWDEHPMRKPLAPPGAEKLDSQYAYGAIAGANRVLDLFVEMQIPADKQVEIEATYAKPEEL